MNPDYPPFTLPPPEMACRRESPRFVPPPAEVVTRRAARRQIADNLKQQILPMSESLRGMTDNERRAVFYKLEHAESLKISKGSLSGTGLKPIAEPGEKFTLVIPREDNFDKLINRVEEFGGGSIRVRAIMRKSPAPMSPLLGDFVVGCFCIAFLHIVKD